MVGTTVQRAAWVDSLRGFACLMVVLLHSAAPYLYSFGKIPYSSWQLANATDSFTRSCVPLFFAMSGYIFFYDRAPQLKHFRKIVANIVFFSLVSLGYWIFVRKMALSAIQWNIYTTLAFFHLWFLYAILLIYVFACFIRIRDVPLRTTLAAAGTIFILFNPLTGDLLKQVGLAATSKLFIEGSSVMYLAYALLGAALGRAPPLDESVRRKVIAASFAAFALAWIVITVVTYRETAAAGKFATTQYGYTSVPTFVATVAAIFLFKESKIPNGIGRFLSFIGAYSLFIYGFHAFFIDYARIGGLRKYQYPLLDIPLTFAITVALSLALAIAVKAADRFRILD